MAAVLPQSEGMNSSMSVNGSAGAASSESKAPGKSMIGVSPVALPPASSWKLSAEERAEISASITQTWTDQAIKCYMTEADCANCSIPRGNYSFQCRMDKVVPVLLETLGHPDMNRIQKLLPVLSH